VNVERDHVLSEQNQPFKDLINALGTCTSLAIVVGAGVSMEAGLPSWDTLVLRILESGLKASQDLDEIAKDHDVKALAKAFLDDTDLLRAATFCQQLHGSNRDAAIRSALYPGSSVATPGRAARAIAALAENVDNVRIITTNYDTLVETAIAEMGGRGATRVVGSSPWPQTGQQLPVPVHHVHGCVPADPRDPIEGDIVLDERDFVFSRDQTAGLALLDLLKAEVILFVGMSINDPNIVTALTKMNLRKVPGCKAFGLFSTSGSNANSTLKRLASTRLANLGITALDLASYSQVSQIIFEALVCRVEGPSRYWTDADDLRYGLRFTAWRRQLELDWKIESKDDFIASQDRLHALLVDTLDSLGSLLGRETGEHLGVHLWARKPGDGLGTMQLWGSSVERHRERWSLRLTGIPIGTGSGYTAVDCLYYGGPQVRTHSTRDQADRWNAIFAQPIDLVDYPWRNLFVGAISLSSTNRLGQSCMKSMDRGKVSELLQTAGRQLLTPSVP
jgi:hypothetical protein